MDAAFEEAKQALADRYDLEGEIGSGGMAVVYRATDLKHDRAVAIKVLRPEVASSVGPERFLREIEIASRLQHPNLVPLFDSGQADDLLYYVMPYVEGESLRLRLDREKQLPTDDAVKIVDDIAEGLEYAHQQGIVHRDIKPENILLTQGGAVLADFGIAQAVQQAGAEKLTKSGVAVGTPVYMAPEQAGGIGTVDFRADQYALACVLYEMLVGEPPFTGPTPQVILARHATDPVPSIRSARSTVPEGMEQAVLRALSKTPADRFPSATGFVEALGQEAVTTGRGRLVPWIAVAAVAGAVLWATLPRQPIAPVSEEDGPNLDSTIVWVAPFENFTGNEERDEVGLAVLSYIYQGLGQIEELTPVSFDVSGRIDSTQTVLERARALGAGTIVHGNYSEIGDNLVFAVDIRRTSDGSTIRPPEQVSGALSELETALETLSARTLGALWAGVLDQDTDMIRLSPPPAVDAVRSWVRAKRLAWDLELPAAEQELRQAISRYPSWTPLKMLLLEFADPSPARDSLLSAVRAAADLNELDRATLRYHASPDYELFDRYDSAKRVSALDPGRPGKLVYHALQMNRVDETLALAGAPVSEPAAPLVWTIALHIKQDHEGELDAARSARTELGEDFFAGPLLVREAVAHVALDRAVDARAIIEEVAQVQSFSYPTVLCAMSQVGRELIAHGYRREGLELLGDAIRWYETNPMERFDYMCELASSAPQLKARLLYEAGDLLKADSVLAVLEQGKSESDEAAQEAGAAISPSMPPYYEALYRGRITARQGGLAAGSQALRAIQERFANERLYFPFFQGLAAIAVLSGDLDLAKEHLQTASTRARHGSRNTWSLYYEVHLDPDFDALREADPAWYDEFMRPKG
jgi:hypothetical protein